MTAFWIIFTVVMVASFYGSLWLSLDYTFGSAEWDPFWLPNHISEDLCEEYEINTAGRCILDILLNIVMLPTMILFLLWFILFWAITLPIMFFAWVFRKR